MFNVPQCIIIMDSDYLPNVTVYMKQLTLHEQAVETDSHNFAGPVLFSTSSIF